MSLANALEHAAEALPALADSIRPANGDPARLLATLDAGQAAQVLGWLLTHEAEPGAELAAAFAEDPRGAPPLLALREASLPKAGRKALGRALHRLRSRGVEVPEVRAAPRTATLPPLADTLAGGFVSNLDPSGARLVVILEPNPGGGARLFELVVDEERGVLDCHVYTAPRRQARSFVRELLARERFSVVEVPVDSARALLARAASRRKGEAPLPRAFEEWRSRLASPPPGAKLPGQLARDALGEAAEAAPHLERAAELVRSRELGPWFPDPDALQRLAEKLREAAQGRVIVSGAARRERLEAAFGECLREAFPPPSAEVMASRLRESSYVLWKSGEDDKARACLAGARAFEERAPDRNPVARALLETALGPALESLRAEEDTSLLVKGDPSLIAKP